MNDFLVYEHWRPDTGCCFYVGKGNRKRSRQMNARNRHHLGIQTKLRGLGLAVEIKIISDGLSEDEAFALEVDRIQYWKDAGLELANHTVGGEGVSGFKLTSEQKAKISLTHRGKKRPQEWKDKIGAAHRGKPKSAKHRENCVAGHAHLRGIPLSEETKAKLSVALKGRVVSPENRERQRQRMIDLHANADRCAIHKKIGDSQRGKRRKPHSPETKAKMSEAAKRRWASAWTSLSVPATATSTR